MSKRFQNHVVWITGGGSGIGFEMALEFARNGADVAVSGRRVEKLAEAVAAIQALGVRGLAVQCDVTDEDNVEKAVAQVVAEFGKLDVAVANAGFGVAGRIEALAVSDWRRQFDTNVTGAVATAKAALPHLRDTAGRIVLIGSIASFVASPGGGPYHASKYAVRAVGQVLSMELAGTGVSCTLIHPGFVKSEIARVDNKGVHHPDREDRRPNKLMWETDRAAKVIVKAIAKRKREFTFTAHGHVARIMGMHFPSLVYWIVRLAGSRQNAALGKDS